MEEAEYHQGNHPTQKVPWETYGKKSYGNPIEIPMGIPAGNWNVSRRNPIEIPFQVYGIFHGIPIESPIGPNGIPIKSPIGPNGIPIKNPIGSNGIPIENHIETPLVSTKFPLKVP